MSAHLDQNEKDCIAACDACATDCSHCFAHMSGQASPNACPSCCVECAAICRLTSDAIARHSPFAKQLAALCAEICDWCAAECGAHEMEHCKTCAASCTRCAEACRALSA